MNQIVLLARIKHVDLYGKLSPQQIEQRTDQLFAQVGRNRAERRGDGMLVKTGFPQLGLAEQPVFAAETFVVEPEQPAILEVGRGDTPTTFQIAVEEILQHPAQGVLGALAGRSAHLGIGGVVLETQLHRSEDVTRQVAMPQTRRRPLRAGSTECGAQQGDLDEVVEVTSLQRGILTVVGKAQQLARRGVQLSVVLQLDERLHGQNRGGGAAVVDAQCRQFEPLGPLALGICDSTGRFQAEQESAFDQRGGNAVPLRDDTSVRMHEHRLWNVVAGIGAYPFVVAGAHFLEGVRQPIEKLLTIAARPGRFLGNIQVSVRAAGVVGLTAVFARNQLFLTIVPDDPNAIVGGPAVAAEDERIQRLVRFARFRRLLGDIQIAMALGLNGCPHRIAAGQELVQAKGEDRKAALGILAQRRSLEQPAAKYLRALLGPGADELRKFCRGASLAADLCALKSARRLPHESAGCGLFTYAEGRLDPRGKRVAPKQLVILRRLRLAGDSITEAGANRGGGGIDLRRRALQRFPDHLLRGEGHPEQTLRHLSHGAPLLIGSAVVGHGGGSADADHVVADGVAAAADQHRHVGPLAAPIGVQLVEHEEPEPLRRSHQLAVLDAGEHQLEHHVIRQEHVRRVVAELFSRLTSFLSRVAGEPHRRLTLWIGRVDELSELLVLAVGEGVHRVDDDRLDAAPGAAAQHAVHDRHDVAKALAGTGAGRQHV